MSTFYAIKQIVYERGSELSCRELDDMDRWLYQRKLEIKVLRLVIDGLMAGACGRDLGQEALDQLKAEVKEITASLQEKEIGTCSTTSEPT